MIAVPASPTERGDRRTRGDGFVWCLAGLFLLLIGWITGWPFLLLLGGFIAVPGMLILLLLRHDRVRRGTSSPNRSRE